MDEQIERDSSAEFAQVSEEFIDEIEELEIIERDLEETKSKIERLDLKLVTKEAAKNYGWSEEQTETAELWYRRYLYLSAKFNEPLAALHKDADRLWHQHIIDCVKYARDCNQIFGYFLVHTPVYDGANQDPAEAKAVERTREIYEAEFGPLPGDFPFADTSGSYSYMNPSHVVRIA